MRLFWLGLCIGLFALVGCSSAPDPWGAETTSPRIVASFPPLASWARSILGDKGSVKTLCTTNGPHHHQFQIKDGQLLRRTDLFLMNGLTLDDHFAGKLAKGHGGPNMRTLNLGQYLPEDLVLETPHNHDEAEAAHPGHDHHHGEKDPHYWLGVPQSAYCIREIAKELAEMDPANAQGFKDRAEILVQEIMALKKTMPERLKGKTDRKVITMHESMAYFAQSYGIKVVDVIQAGPGDEPSSPRLSKLVERCKKVGIKTIIVEPQYPKTTAAQWLLSELKKSGLDARLIEIDPMETCEDPSGPDAKWYVRILGNNLDRLVEGLP